MADASDKSLFLRNLGCDRIHDALARASQFLRPSGQKRHSAFRDMCVPTSILFATINAVGGTGKQHLIFRLQRLRRIQDDQRQIRVRHRLIAAFDPKLLDAILAGSNSGGIDETNRNTVERSGFRDRVARGTRNLRDNRPILFDQPIEQAALADIGPSDDRQVKILRAPACRRQSARQWSSPSSTWDEPAKNLLFGATSMSSSAKSIPASSSEISSSNCSFKGHATGHRAFYLLRGDASLIMVVASIRSRTASAWGRSMRPFKIASQREFAWFGGTGSGEHRSFDAKTQDNWRAMTGDLNQIFGSVGTRSREEGGDNLIDCLAILIDKRAQCRSPWLPGVLARKSEDAFRDASRVRP